MILRVDRLGVELPPPSTPDPAGAAAVQELMGGKFGEMSTFMNYTFRKAAGLPDKVTGIVADGGGNGSIVEKVKEKVS
jgi:Mn-containing catalase